MKNNIIALVDYKENFGSKHFDEPYRSGMDKLLLEKHFTQLGWNIRYVQFSKVDLRNNQYEDEFIIYTSSEDVSYHYKSYIEDIVYSLELSAANVIPEYKFLRANNNKVFMESIRHIYGQYWNDKLISWVFGTYEEMQRAIDDIPFPIVIKTAEGAMSTGVFLAENKKELISRIKRISRTKHTFQEIKDYLRPFKHKGYAKESLHRNKFILQQFVPNLINDWKILIYGDKYFILTRYTKENDFRASGSHQDYKPGSKSILPEGIFDFSKKVFEALQVPHLSLDVVFDGNDFYLLEFQAVYFGNSTYNMSDVFYVCENGKWIERKNNLTIEEIYVDCITSFISNNENSFCQ